MNTQTPQDYLQGLKSCDAIKGFNLDESTISISNEDSKTVIDQIQELREKDFLKPFRIIIETKVGLIKKNLALTNLNKCTFKENVCFEDLEILKLFCNNTTFCKEVHFDNIKFNGKVRFHDTKFCGPAYFLNSHFSNLLDFYFSKFSDKVQFHRVDFYDVTVFSNCSFIREAQFLHNKVGANTYLNFENSEFINYLDLSRANFNCPINFWNIKLGKEDLKEDKKIRNTIRSISLYQNDGYKSKEDVGEQGALQRVRESMRLIKFTLQSQGNYIQAQHFHRKEMSFYETEVWSFKGRFWEGLMLSLNNHSNTYGTSWQAGLKFTLGVTAISFLCFLKVRSSQLELSFEKDAILTTLRYFLELLNLAKWDYKPFEIVCEKWDYIILFISRIFIGFGYYQLIQAFRKYKKN